MKFNYKKLPSGHLRPIVKVGVKNGEQSIDYFVLIDSGADLCLFHSEIADLIGIDVKSGIREEVGGITEGEKQSYYLHDIILNIGGWDFPVTVGFMPTLSRLGHGLVGQRGFFDKFKSVNFDYNNGDIELKMAKK